jgi:transposase
MIRQAGERVRYPRFSADETARLVELYEAGLSQKDIAERLGRSPSAVWHYDGQDSWGRQTAAYDVGPHFARQ